MNKSSSAPAHNGMSGPCALFILALTVLSASAAPAWKKELSSPVPGPFPAIASSSLELQLSWKGMLNSGKVNIDFAPKNAKKSGAFVVRSTAASLGPASGLFPYQNHFWSELHPGTWKPIYFHAVETDRKETVTTTTRHFKDRVESTEITKLLKDGKTKRTDRIFKYAPVFDIFSAMLHIRSQKLDAGDLITLVVHPFDNPYLLRVKVVGRELHMDQNTIRLSVGMRKIDRETLELKPYKKMKSDATLWLSDDANRVPVEFRAAVFIGDIRATMTRFGKS